MADLKTNYVDDVLDTTKNQLRKYQKIQNDDGTVSFVDVTEYTQVGTSFGAKDINDTNAAINDVNRKLDKRSYSAETISATTFTIVRKTALDLIIIAVDNQGGVEAANNYFIVIGDTVKSIAGGWTGITCTLSGHTITLNVIAYCAVGILSTNEIAVTQ